MSDPVDIRVGGKVLKTGTTFNDFYGFGTRVVPKESGEIRAEMSLASLLRVNRLASVMDSHSNAVKIAPEKGEMSFSAPDSGEVIVPVSGHGIRFGLNIGYFTALARVAHNFALTGKSASDPFVARGEDADAMWVIMPICGCDMPNSTLCGNGDDCPACSLRREGDPSQRKIHPCNNCGGTGRIARSLKEIVEKQAAEARRSYWSTKQWWLAEQEAKRNA
jgi:hypothetical protein